MHLSWQARLHAGSVDARRCLQSFLLRRALSLYPKQCCPRTDRHFRWRGRKDADLIGSSASIRRWRTNNGPSLGEVSCTPEIAIAAARLCTASISIVTELVAVPIMFLLFR